MRSDARSGSLSRPRHRRRRRSRALRCASQRGRRRFARFRKAGRMTEDWLTVRRGDALLLVSLPHTGVYIPDESAAGLISPALARPWVCAFLKRITWPLALTTHAQFGHPAVQKSPPAAG